MKNQKVNRTRAWLVFMLMSFLLGIGRAEAQERLTVTGTVVSGTDGEPLIGVNIKEEGTANGTISDIDGKFSLQTRKGVKLEFSFIGFKTETVKVTSSIINVSLKEDNEMLDEVVVIGYGTMKRSDLTGAVASVSADVINKTVATSLDQVLQGRAAGVAVTQNSGAPGGGISVSIRGTNSLSGNEPLYVIDGIPVSGSTGDNSSALSNINPADIVSMEVLKDASASAIYGSRASNGVVLITTKRGEKGKNKFSYQGYYALQQLPKKLDVMNLREFAQYRNMLSEISSAYGSNSFFEDVSVLGEGTDWQGELFRTAPMQSHQLSLSGGSDKFRYMLSGAYLSQDGIAIGSGFDRLTFRTNLDNNLTKWLTMGVNASVAYSKQNNTIDNNGIIETAIKQTPETPARNPDGSFGTQAPNMYGTYYPNPIEQALQRENYNKKLDIYANMFAEFKIWKGLSFRLEYGGSFYYKNSYSFTPSYDYDTYTQQSYGSRSAGNGFSTTFKTYLNYNETFGKHTVGAMVGHEAQESGWESLSGSRTGYLFNTIHELDAGDANSAQNSSSRGSWAMESYYGRLNYSFDDRYLLTATVRADGSSNLGRNNRWGVFPSVALAWKISSEKFMEGFENLSGLKLRAGWGLVGNQSAGSYAYGTKMSTATSVRGTGFYAGNYPNEDLKWEETEAFNVGLDLTLFSNRIELILDAYLKRTDNLIMQASLPSYVNGVISSPYVNAGAMENKGFEITLNTVNISNKNFSWQTGITFSLNRNKVTKLYTETAGLPGETDGETYTYTMVGEPVGQFYGYKKLGIFMSEADFYQKDANGFPIYDNQGNPKLVALPKDTKIDKDQIWVGDYIWQDSNGDGVIDEKDRVFLGNPDPKFTFGINNTFTYKNFDLNIFLNGSYGNKVYNCLRRDYLNPGYSGAFTDALGFAQVSMIDPDGSDRDLGNVCVANSNPTTHRVTELDTNTNDRLSDAYIEDASYLRVKNISLGYTFPKKWISKLGIDMLRVYVNVQNAFTITGYKGYDPEVGAQNQNVLLRGIDNARYPTQRTWTFGLNLDF